MLFISNNANETFYLGKKIAKKLKAGDVLGFSGELGAGKTVLIKGLAQGLGIKKTVRSPSFNLMRVYRLPRPQRRQADLRGGRTRPIRGIKTLAHLDCYRLTTPQEAIDIGLLDYLADKKTLTVIEWPERIKKILPKNRTKTIRLKVLNEFSRSIILPFGL